MKQLNAHYLIESSGLHVERQRGPVLVELIVYGRIEREPFTSQAERVWRDARRSLEGRGCAQPGYADISSEAIEAAEALGL